MLNHKTIFKQKSKILLIILSIFGLAFSYSCSCRSGGDPTRVNGGAVSGSYKIILENSGTDMRTNATVKFLNATGTLTKVEDSDTANQFELADLNYTGTTLTLTDSGKAKAPEGELKTIKATFSLTKSADNVDLTTTEQVVDIEIGKMAPESSVLTVISDDFKKIQGVVGNQGDFTFYNNSINGETIEVGEDNENQSPTTTSAIKTAFEKKFNDVKSQMAKITKIEFDSIEVDAANKKKATFKYKIFLIDVYEKKFETTPLSIILTMKSTDWTDDYTPAN